MVMDCGVHTCPDSSDVHMKLMQFSVYQLYLSKAAENKGICFHLLDMDCDTEPTDGICERVLVIRHPRKVHHLTGTVNLCRNF